MFTAGLLRYVRYLKNSDDYQSVHVTADCSAKKRNERKKMVVELKKKIEAEPEQYHFIKGENNLSRPKHSGHDSGLIFSRNSPTNKW